jgi:hypothetical protein
VQAVCRQGTSHLIILHISVNFSLIRIAYKKESPPVGVGTSSCKALASAKRLCDVHF